jgi:hypothetical protein
MKTAEDAEDAEDFQQFSATDVDSRGVPCFTEGPMKTAEDAEVFRDSQA